MLINSVVLAPEEFGTLEAKTANVLIMYEEKYKVVAVIDESKKGLDAGEVIGLGRKNIPIVGGLKEALRYNPKALIIGTAPVSGHLPATWRPIIKEAIMNKLDIVSGLHDFFSDDMEFIDLAEKSGVQLIDVRKQRRKMDCATGAIRFKKTPVVDVLSTDGYAGKNIVIMELMKEARKRNINTGYVATGQTMSMMGPDAHCVIDALIADFMSGELERLVLEADKKGRDILFVEGQGSLSHIAYGCETLMVIYGSWPDAIVLAHNPFLKKRQGFPDFDMPRPEDEIRKLECVFPQAKVVAVTINGYKKSEEEVRDTIDEITSETGLPCTDVYRFGAKKILDAILDHLKEKGKPIEKG